MLEKNTWYFWGRGLAAEQGDRPSSPGTDYLWEQGDARKTQSDYPSHNTSNNLLACLQTLHVWPFLDCTWLATPFRNWYPNGFYTQNRNCVLVSNEDICISIYKYIYNLNSSDSDKQLQRLLARNELSEPEARNRIDSQMPLETKCEKSHFVIDNNGSIEDAEAAALRIYNLMQDSKQHWYNRITILGVVLFVALSIYFLNKVLNFWPKSLSF